MPSALPGGHSPINQEVKSMIGHRSSKWLGFPEGSLSSIEEHSGLLGVVTIPLLHGITGSGGFWDEILMALVRGLVIILILSLVLVGNRGETHDEDE
jgi:hypothetical protein